MRRVKKRNFPYTIRHIRLKFVFVAILSLTLWFNCYVNQQIRPTLMKLAEYEARAQTTQAIHVAVDSVIQLHPDLCSGLYVITQDSVQLDLSRANTVRSILIQAVGNQLDHLPEREYCIPFGSLTGNSLLSGRGPGWKMQLQPEGFVEAEWKENSKSLSINTTQYQAGLALTVTLNMILDGRTETMTICDEIPLVSLLLRGETPTVYGAISD